MPKNDMKTTTELILSLSIADIPISLRGSLESGKLGELSGCVAIRKSLGAFLADLGADFGDASRILKQLTEDQISDIVLNSLAFGYRNLEPKFAQIAVTLTAGGSRCRFVILKRVGKDGFVAGLDLQSDGAVLKNNLLSGLIGEISIGDLGIYYASDAFQKVRYDPRETFQDAVILTPTIPPSERDFTKGLNWSAEIFVGCVNLLDQMAIQKAETTAPKERQPSKAKDEASKAEETLAKGSTHWIQADKSIGPLSIRRIGLSYEAQKLGIKLDAGLQLSVLTLSLEGLGLSYPINKFSTKPKEIWDNLEFHLDGAAVAFSGGPLTISGGLLKVEDPKYPDRLQLDGFLLVRTEILTITALGSYADMDGTPSLFVFAALQKELGGPAFFFVTGLSVGFGINRALKLPAINEVHNFPLVKAATDPDYLDKDLDLRNISQKLGDYIYPLQGNFWIAAGVKFNSFGLIDSFAMLTVSFGIQLQVALLGLAKISVPKQLPAGPKVPAIACAELAIKVTFSPSTGILAAEARLTDNSFLFTKDCRLTGGFAFYCWFAGTHEGDFVVTLGGYHAQFDKPLHYPVVPRLRIHWPVSAELSITGEAYFALTPSCLMAGGKLDAVFQSGPIRAWFYVRADFLIAWKPFRYDIDVGVRIGVAFRTDLFTLTTELTASLHMWGPPFGGMAHVTWFVISFDIPFGKQEPDEPEKLSWEEFHQSFLPQRKEGGDPLVSTIRITSGLINEREVKVKELGVKRTLRLVNAHALSFTTESVIPSTAIVLNGKDIIPKENTPKQSLGIRPMGKDTLHSEHKVSLVRKHGDSQNGLKDNYLDFDFESIPKNVPYALWSKDLSRLNAPSAETIKNVPAGLRVSLKTRAPEHALTPIDLEKFKYEKFEKSIPWTEVREPTEIPAQGENTLMNTIWNNPTVTLKRNSILDALKKSQEIESINLQDLAKHAKEIFQAMPEMACLGEPLKPPKSV